MTCGIYKITCVPTGDTYVGASVDIEQRFESHLKQPSNSGLSELLNRFGETPFQLDLLEACEKGILRDREAFWISRLSPTLNVAQPSAHWAWRKVMAGKVTGLGASTVTRNLGELVSAASISKLRKDLTLYRRQVQRGDIVPVDYYKDRVGYLVPVGIAQSLNLSLESEMGLIDFRDNLNSAWESVYAGTDCIWLTYHGERRLAFVSSRVYSPDS